MTGATATINLTDSDPYSTVTITGLPDDLSAFNGGAYTPGGTPDTGTWTGTGAEFNALSFTTGAAGTYTLSIAASENGQTATATDTLVVQSGSVEPFIWATAVSGDWSDGTKWSSGAEPVTTDQASIDVTGTYTVTVDVSDTVAALNVGNTSATLAIATGVALTVAGTANTSATPNVIAGAVQNSGTLQIQSGTLELTGSVSNSSLLEATAGGTLYLSGDVDNAYSHNGDIAAYDGSTIQLAAGVTVTDGTITVGATGDTTDQLLVGGGDDATLINLNVNNYGTALIDSGAMLTLEGSAIFGGTVTDNGTNGALDTNGNSAINNAQVDAQVAVTAGTLTLDDVTFTGGTITNSGAIDATGSDKNSGLRRQCRHDHGGERGSFEPRQPSHWRRIDCHRHRRDRGDRRIQHAGGRLCRHRHAANRLVGDFHRHRERLRRGRRDRPPRRRLLGDE